MPKKIILLGGQTSIVQQTRRNLGLNNIQFAVKTGLSTATISAIERHKPVSRLSAAKVCRALGLDIEDLVEQGDIVLVPSDSVQLPAIVAKHPDKQ